jgi:large subunit ribosomal protein L4
MLEVAVYNVKGEQVDTLEVDEAALGGSVNPSLVKQAVVMYHANSHQHTAETKGRSQVRGSTRKLYRQKGTGLARRGAIRTGVMRGGGVIFAKRAGGRRRAMPRRMRRAALQSAVLAKILGGDLLVVDELSLKAPRTKELAGVLRNLNIDRSCVLALAGADRAVYLSARNIPRLTVRTAAELNAYDVATRQKMLVTADGMKALVGEEVAS